MRPQGMIFIALTFWIFCVILRQTILNWMMNSTSKKLLLQICCAPDAAVVVERIRGTYDITGFFYNPNIHPEEEFRLRADEMRRLAFKMDFPVEIGPYDAERWFALTQGMEAEVEGGKRCTICFRMRLEAAAEFALIHQFEIFTTVLTVSPHKDADLVNSIGTEIGLTKGLRFLESNFKKRDGFKRSIELSRLYHLYRQDYCGCSYSQPPGKRLSSG